MPREEAAARAFGQPMLEEACIRASAVWGCGLLELGLAVLLRQPMLGGACIRACAARGCGLLEFGLAALLRQQMLDGAASGRALRGVVGCLSLY